MIFYFSRYFRDILQHRHSKSKMTGTAFGKVVPVIMDCSVKSSLVLFGAFPDCCQGRPQRFPFFPAHQLSVILSEEEIDTDGNGRVEFPDRDVLRIELGEGQEGIRCDDEVETRCMDAECGTGRLTERGDAVIGGEAQPFRGIHVQGESAFCPVVGTIDMGRTQSSDRQPLPEWHAEFEAGIYGHGEHVGEWTAGRMEMHGVRVLTGAMLQWGSG